MAIVALAGCTKSATYPDQCKKLLPGWVHNDRGFGILGFASDIRLRKNGQITVDRKPVTQSELAQLSRSLGELNPRIFVTFQADDGAACQKVDAVRAIINTGNDCNGENRGLCGEGPGPWPVFGDVPPFPIVREYKEGRYRWLDEGVTNEEWLAANAHSKR